MMYLDFLENLVKAQEDTMQLDLVNKLVKIVREIERCQQDLLELHKSHYQEAILSKYELSALNAVIKELDNCSRTIDTYRYRIINNRILRGREATDK